MTANVQYRREGGIGNWDSYGEIAYLGQIWLRPYFPIL